MKAIVYVEGPSDRDALQALLKDIIAEGRAAGLGIRLLPKGSKARLLDEVPAEAADYLLERPQDWVIALPDLYPMARFDGTTNAHGSVAALRDLLLDRFNKHADSARLSAEVRSRFLVHVLKHDLEALLPAAADALRRRLGTNARFQDRWRQPVEDQNDERPPKRVVENLFREYRKKNYIDTVDAPWILGRADLKQVEQACPQCFTPFTDALRTMVGEAGVGRTPEKVTSQGG